MRKPLEPFSDGIVFDSAASISVMIILYAMNLAWFPLIFIAPSIFFTHYFRLFWLNPLTAVAGAYLPSLMVTSFVGPAAVLEDGLFNPYFQYALLVSNLHDTLGALALIVLVSLFRRNRGLMHIANRVAHSGGQVSPEHMRRATLFFLGLYFVSFILLAQHSFSVFQWIASPRTGYQLHREGAGQWFALAITALSVSFVLMATYQRSTRKVLAYSPLYIYLVYLLGSKGLIVNFAVYLIVMLAIRKYRYLGPMIFLIGVGAAALVVSSLLSALGNLDLTTLAGYSDGYTNAARYYEKHLHGDLPLLDGKLFITDIWSLVPRALYPDKPHVYGVTLITDVFYPGAAEQTNTPAFATVAYFADFGWTGVVLSALFNPGNLLTACLYSLVLPRLELLKPDLREPHFLFLTYAFLLLAAPDFLLFFDFPNNAFLFTVIAVVINLANRLRSQPTADAPGRRAKARVQSG